MLKTPKGNRLHIGIFGRRNVGKSALLNALTRQTVSIVSEIAGTTTDPVEKPMEMLPIGPVLFIDTAGIDDEGFLGAKRIARTRQIFDRVDIGILVAEASTWSRYERELVAEFKKRQVPVIVAFNKSDLYEPAAELLNELNGEHIPAIRTIATQGRGAVELRAALIDLLPEDFLRPPGILDGLVKTGETIVLVVPIDKEAPKGRIILPQVQTIRAALDSNAQCVVVTEFQLSAALRNLQKPPVLVVTDSQVFAKVAADTPPEIPMTSFSILFARQKGDLQAFIGGARTIAALKPGDAVLIAEACTHHPIADDIGTEKIPRWLNHLVGGELHFEHAQGHDFPEDLPRYQLVIQCGSCMQNRREVLTRIARCQSASVPITNYGLAIAYAHGILERAIAPFRMM